MQGLLLGTDAAELSPPAPPSESASINIAAIVGASVAALVVLIVAILLTTRRRRGHNFQRDAWGLPINPVVRSALVDSHTPAPRACVRVATFRTALPLCMPHSHQSNNR